MKHQTSICFLRDIMIAVVLPIICIPLRAADEPKKVLGTTAIDLGTRSVIFQRVEPPVETAALAATPATAATAAASALAREGAILKWSRQRSEFLSLSCIVFESGVTEVRWWAGGAEYRIVASIDFNNLRGLGSFTTAERSYLIFMSIGNAMSAGTAARLRAGGAALPASVTTDAPVSAGVLADLRQSGSPRYVIVSAPEKADAEAFRGVDDLLRHYDTHKDEIIAAWRQGEAERLANEQWLKEHPPVPQDTVIQFWPKKGSRYLDAGAGATAGDAAADAGAGTGTGVTTLDGKEGEVSDARSLLRRSLVSFVSFGQPAPRANRDGCE